jgi:dihydroflavonol-4-reductase
MLGGNWHTLREVAVMAAAFTQRSAPWLTVPFWLADAFAPVMLRLANFSNTHPIYTRVTLEALRGDRHVSSARAELELGYAARPLSETVYDTLTWFQEQGYLQGSRP